MSLMGLKLWHIDVPQGTEMRSVASDLFVENEVEHPSRPVTVCHIETGAGDEGCGAPLHDSVMAFVTNSQGVALGCARAHLWCSLGRDLRSGFRRGRTPAPKRALGDSFAAGAPRTATFGDSRRQNLGLPTEARGGVLRGRQPRAVPGDLPKATTGERLMANCGQATVGATHANTLMGSGSRSWKGSETTTKSDTMQKPG